MLGDAEEPDAVPASPNVGEEAQVARQLRPVPALDLWMHVRLEGEIREDDGCPDRRATPEEDVENTADGATLLHPRRGKRPPRRAAPGRGGDGRASLRARRGSGAPGGARCTGRGQRRW